MGTKVLPQHFKRAKRRPGQNIRIPGHRANGSFKISKRGKYNQQGRFIDEHWFASKAEADRYEQLREMVASGTIDGLELQAPFPCHVNGVLVTTYRADFRYCIRPRQFGQRWLVEDVKGMATKEYAIKKRLVEALYPTVKIIELNVPRRGGVARFRFLTADQFNTTAKEERHAARPELADGADGG